MYLHVCTTRSLLDEILRDRPVCGIQTPRLLSWLLREPSLIFSTALVIIQVFESAAVHSTELNRRGRLLGASKSGTGSLDEAVTATGLSQGSTMGSVCVQCHRCLKDTISSHARPARDTVTPAGSWFTREWPVDDGCQLSGQLVGSAEHSAPASGAAAADYPGPSSGSAEENVCALFGAHWPVTRRSSDGPTKHVSRAVSKARQENETS